MKKLTFLLAILIFLGAGFEAKAQPTELKKKQLTQKPFPSPTKPVAWPSRRNNVKISRLLKTNQEAMYMDLIIVM
jgi:hypothetical protein